MTDSILPLHLLDHADAVRREVAPRIALKRKSELGQFMTPAPVTCFMASLFPPATLQTCRLLDAGAGVGALTCAFLDRWTSGDGLDFHRVEVEAHEIDNALRGHLEPQFEQGHAVDGNQTFREGIGERAQTGPQTGRQDGRRAPRTWDTTFY